MKLGYARVSTDEDNLELQIEALRSAGVELIYEDKDVSGSAVIKPAYNDMVRSAQPGDEIIVWRLDRLSRSLGTLMIELEKFGRLNVGFRSLSENIETISPEGRMFFQMVGAFRQFERDVIAERSNASDPDRGSDRRQRGRPPVISDEQWSRVRTLIEGDPPISAADAAKLLGVSRQAVHKRLKAIAESQRLTVANDAT